MSDLLKLKQIEAYENFLAELKAAETGGQPYHIERLDWVSGWQPITAAMANYGPGERLKVVYHRPKPKPRKAWVLYVAPHAVDPWGMAFAAKEDAGTKSEAVEMEEVLRGADGERIPSESEQKLLVTLGKFGKALSDIVKNCKACSGATFIRGTCPECASARAALSGQPIPVVPSERE